MNNHISRRMSVVISLLLVLQLLFPVMGAFAATNNSILPPSNLASQLLTPDDVKLTWSAVSQSVGYNVYGIVDGQLKLLGTTTTTSYTFNNLPEGSYSYVVSTLSAGGESGPCAPVTVNIVYPSMAAPTSLTYTMANGNDIVLNWTVSTYAETYNLYQISADGQKTLVTSLSGHSYTSTNVPAGTYTYAVSAVNSLYGESPISNPVQATVVFPTMATPGNFTYSIANGNDITLRWGSVSYATKYNVYQIVDGQKVLKGALTGTSVTYTNQPSGDYIFEIHSYSDRFGESINGSQVSFTLGTVTMAAPANFTGSIKNLSDIALTWGSVSNATAYNIYQMIDGQPVLKSTVTGTSLTYTNQPAGDYVLVVHSYSDRFGESADSSQVSLTIGSVTMEAPVNLSYTIQNGNDIVLTWAAAANATGYKIYQIVNGNSILKSTISGTSVTYTNMPAGDYSYEVHSYSTRFGDSAEGSQVSFTLVLPTMIPPANVIQIAKNATDFTLSWDASSFATSYKVYQIVNGQKVLKSTLSNTSVTYTGMSAGDYTYEIHSYNGRFGESADGNQVTFTFTGQTMQPPTNPTYTISNGNDITLKWTAAPYATSYKVYQVVNGQPVLKSTVYGTSVTYSNQLAGTYNYVIDSVSTTLGESPSGAEVTFDLIWPTMAAPGNLVAKIQNGSDVVLTWLTVPYANSYKVYELVNGQEVLNKSVTGLTATLSNVQAGNHIFTVHSVSTRFGESQDASQASITVNEQTMLAPSNVTQTIANGNDITLKWNAVTYATNYKVYQIVDGQKVLKSTVTGTSATYTNMPAGDYAYEIHSYSSYYGESSDGGTISFTLVFPIMQTPGNVIQTVANGNDITLRWNVVTYATNYKVYQIVNGQKVLKSTVTGTSVTYTNMPEGDYAYEIHSYSSRFGESSDGGIVNFTLTWPVVQPPVLNGSIVNANNVAFSWKAATWANEYRVYEVTGDTRQQIYKGTALSYQVNNLTETTHFYEMTAYSTRFGESAPSNRLAEKIVYPVMQPPVASLKLLSSTSAQISWNFVTYANGYNVYEIIDGKPKQLTNNLNNLSFTVQNLSYANHEYYVSSYSNSFGESVPSNTVLAKLIVDTTPPVTNAIAPSYWTTQVATVTLTATDNETGVANTYYSVNDSAFVSGTTILVDTEGINKVSFYSVDNVNNKEAAQTIYVKIDKTAPVTNIVVPTTWTKDDVTINLTATDVLSGIAKTYYSIDGSDMTEGTTFTLHEAGNHKISYYSIDIAGNKETTNTSDIDVKIDRTAPVTAANTPAVWSKEDVTLTLMATDSQSEVAKTFYSINGSDYSEGNAIIIYTEGLNHVSFYSVDQVGNIEKVQTVEVKVDKTAPVTNVVVPTAWTKDDVTVNLTATDEQSGIVKTYYSIDGSEMAEGTSFTLHEEGTHKISYYSIDIAGNKEITKTSDIDVKIDRTAPVTAATPPAAWSREDVTLTFIATDSQSGIAKTFYSINGSDYLEGNAAAISTEGLNQISFYSVDRVGNIEKVQTVEVKVDKTAPVTMSDSPAIWSSKDVLVNLAASDELSGVAKTFYSIDSAADIEGTSFTVQIEGIHTISYYSVDTTGNIENKNSSQVKIDKTAPTITMDLNNEYKLGDSLQLSYSAKDSLSGIVSESMTVTTPTAAGNVMVNGTTVKLDKPGIYTVNVTVTDAAGLTTTIQRKFGVYIPATIEVTPNVIKGNKGVFTVRVALPTGYSTQSFDLNTATLNGVKALTSNNGYYNQAKIGQFKFERSDFNWTPSEMVVVFRGYVDGNLVVGQTTVKVQQ